MLYSHENLTIYVPVSYKLKMPVAWLLLGLCMARTVRTCTDF